MNYQDEDGFHLGNWIAYVRQKYQRGLLSEDEVNRLNALSMVWQCRDFAFERNFSEAEKYFKEHGDLNVTRGVITDNGVRLGLWIQYLRSMKAAGSLKLTDLQIGQLDSISMQWEECYELAWRRGFEEAKLYFEENGHLNPLVQFKSKTGYPLGKWVWNQRRAATKPHFNKKRYAMRAELLNSIGMIWAEETSWEKRCRLLEAYKKEYGNLDISQEYVVEGIWLGKWLAVMRRIKIGEIKGTPLTEEQTKKLESLGVRWNETKLENAWNEIYAEAVKYFQERGDSEVPLGFVTESGKKLGFWIQNQRMNFLKGKLSEDRKSKLSAINMRYENAFDLQWAKKYSEAKAYFEEHGDLSVSFGVYTESGFPLGRWLSRQRCDYRSGKLSEDKTKQLETLNIDWYFDIRKYNQIKRNNEKKMEIPKERKTSANVTINPNVKEAGRRGVKKENRSDVNV
jgi:hypothetical protein